MVRGIALVLVAAAGVLVLGSVPLRAQQAEALQEGEPDPCAYATRQGELNTCWAREAERADIEMRQAYETLLETLPSGPARNLKKAQKLWLQFRDAHLGTLYGAPEARATYGPEYPMCLSIARLELARDRTRELKRLLHPDKEGLCPF